MTKQQAGAAIFAAIKQDLKSKGASMTTGRFPKDYPISQRHCYMIGRGQFNEAILERLPFKCRLEYSVKFGE